MGSDEGSDGAVPYALIERESTSTAAQARGCVVACSLALINGYCLCVVAGAVPLLEDVYALSTLAKSLLVSINVLGALAGGVVGGVVADAFGRRAGLRLCGLSFTVGSLMMAAAPTFEVVVAGRFITGFGTGLSGVINPIYLAEVAPPHLRGQLVTTNEILLTIGCLLALLANLFLHTLAPSGWRWMLGLSGPLAALSTVGTLFVPETDAWLDQQQVLSTLECPAAAPHATLSSDGAGASSVPPSVSGGCTGLRAGLCDSGSSSGTAMMNGAATSTACAPASAPSHTQKATPEPAPTSLKCSVTAPHVGRYARCSSSPHARRAPVRTAVSAFSVVYQPPNASAPVVEDSGHLLSSSLMSLPSVPTRLFLPTLTRVVSSRDPERGEGSASSAGAAASPTKRARGRPTVWAALFGKSKSKELWVVLGLAVANNFNMAQALQGFSTDILLQAGVPSPFLFSVISGVGRLLGVCLCVSLVDRVGRRPLLLAGAAGMGISYAAISTAYALQSPLVIASGFTVLFCCWSASWAGLVWTVSAELLPAHLRAHGMALTIVLYWVLAFITSEVVEAFMMWLTPQVACALFGGGCFAAMAYVALCVPETLTAAAVETRASGTHSRSTIAITEREESTFSTSVRPRDRDSGSSDDSTVLEWHTCVQKPAAATSAGELY